MRLKAPKNKRIKVEPSSHVKRRPVVIPPMPMTPATITINQRSIINNNSTPSYTISSSSSPLSAATGTPTTTSPSRGDLILPSPPCPRSSHHYRDSEQQPQQLQPVVVTTTSRMLRPVSWWAIVPVYLDVIDHNSHCWLGDDDMVDVH